MCLFPPVVELDGTCRANHWPAYRTDVSSKSNVVSSLFPQVPTIAPTIYFENEHLCTYRWRFFSLAPTPHILAPHPLPRRFLLTLDQPNPRVHIGGVSRWTPSSRTTPVFSSEPVVIPPPRPTVSPNGRDIQRLFFIRAFQSSCPHIHLHQKR